MTDGQTVYLAIMAAALVVLAGIQIGVLVAVIKVGRHVSSAADELRREVRPLLENAHRISEDAARLTSLAVVQVERVDQLLASTSSRVDETLGVIQDAVIGPIRQGAAVMAAVKAALSAFRPRASQSHHGPDDDALFVG